VITADIGVVPIEGRARGALRRGVLVSLSHAGLVMHGEASPLPGRSRETLDDVLAALAQVGSRLDVDLASPMTSVDRALPASLRFALETAASRLARALAGGSLRVPELETQVLGEDLASIDHELAALALGARTFKLKIRSAAHTQRVSRLREHAPDARLRVDANRSFATARDVPWDALACAGVEWIEEPCPDAAAIADAPVPIALDESIEDDRDRSIEAVCAGRIAAVVLKPTMLGAREVLSISAVARAHGVRTVVSHAFESEVGRLAALELAAVIAPTEAHGLARWPGIASFRSEEEHRADPRVV
jgi:o-succinylbenzoate synthase